MWNKKLFIFFCGMLLLVFSGCKVTKPAIVAVPLSESETLAQKMQVKNAAIKTIDASRVIFTIPNNDVTIKTNGSMKVVVDSCMVLSFQALFGIEVVRVKLTKDSVLIIDRLNQRYFSDSFAVISSLANIPIDYFSLQGLMLNRVFDPAKENNFKNFVSSESDQMHSLQLASSSFHTQFLIDQNYALKRTFVSSNDNSVSLMAEYSNFNGVNGIDFPFATNLFLSTASRQLSADYAVEKVDFNTQVEVKTIIPSKYKRIYLSDIKGIFK